MTGNLIWIASYPKSGNTWFRLFLTALLENRVPGELDFNALDKIPIASCRKIFDARTGLESSELSANEIRALRPEVYRHLSQQAKDPLYFKVHDACSKLANGRYLFEPEVTRAVIYILRNPLDIAVSWASFFSHSLEKSIANICDTDLALARNPHKLSPQLMQQLSDWSSHVLSWTNGPHPICILRYEDMVRAPVETFARAIAFLQLNRTEKQIADALKACTFERMVQEERRTKFEGAPAHCEKFFRKGRIGDYRHHLTKVQCQTLIRCHEKVMTQFGYLDDKGHPFF